MPSPSAAAQAKRELRLKIARQRRRIDRHVRLIRQEGLRLLSWQTYLGRVPSLALATLESGLGRLVRLPRHRWVRASYRLLRRVVVGVFRRLWAWLRPRSEETVTTVENTAGPTPSGGGDGV